MTLWDLPRLSCSAPWLRAATVAPRHRDFDGLVVDLRGEEGSDGVFRKIVDLRGSFLSWLGGKAVDLASNVPIVLVGGAVELDAARRWSMDHGGPALWFSLGVELVELSKDPRTAFPGKQCAPRSIGWNRIRSCAWALASGRSFRPLRRP